MARPNSPYRSHLIPRTLAGRIATAAFVALLALAEPPVVHRVVATVSTTVLGLPFLYVWLLGVYVAMIAVLIWALGRGL